MLRVRNLLTSLVFTALACLGWINIAAAMSQLDFANAVNINPASGLDPQGGNIGYTFTVKNSGSLSANDTTLVVTFLSDNIPIFDSTRACVFTKTSASLVAKCPLHSIPSGSPANPTTVNVTLVVHPTGVSTHRERRSDGSWRIQGDANRKQFPHGGRDLQRVRHGRRLTQPCLARLAPHLCGQGYQLL
jgi:hypothetical protein